MCRSRSVNTLFSLKSHKTVDCVVLLWYFICCCIHITSIFARNLRLIQQEGFPISFQSFHFDSGITQALSDLGISEPTTIQSEVIPEVMQGNNVLALAQTGSGKTLAYGAPILQRLLNSPNTAPRCVRALVIVPTRELAMQVRENIRSYAEHLTIRCECVFGGVDIKKQMKMLSRQPPDILVSTPGRLKDILTQPDAPQGLFDQCGIAVLDEADRLFEATFLADTKYILSTVPASRQMLMFSATMPKNTEATAHELMGNYVLKLAQPRNSTVETIDQQLYYVDRENKFPLLLHILSQGFDGTVLIFTATKYRSRMLAEKLNEEGYAADVTTAGMSMNSRQKKFTALRSGQTQILISTNLLARGVDAENISLIIQYDIPDAAQEYIHRIGRTGRAGRSGIAISMSEFWEQKYIRNIEKLMKKPIPVVTDHPFPMVCLDVPRDRHGKPIDPNVKESRDAARAHHAEMAAKRRERETQEAAKEAEKAASLQQPQEKKPADTAPEQPSPRRRRRRRWYPSHQ